MDAETMEAVRLLMDFAESHAEEIYLEEIGDDEQLAGNEENCEQLLEAVKTMERYMDGDAADHEHNFVPQMGDVNEETGEPIEMCTAEDCYASR